MSQNKPEFSSPCPYFPACGGCDFLDLDQKSYQNLKRETLAKSFPDAHWVWVDANSRRKIILQVGFRNELGFFGKKSNAIVEAESCFAAEEKISTLILPLKNLLKNFEENIFTQISITLFDNGLDVIFVGKRELNSSQNLKLLEFAKTHGLNISYRFKNHAIPIFLNRKNQIFYPDFKINLDSEIFIQATKSGLEVITKIIRQNLNGAKKLLDIYAGFGAYSFGIVDLAKTILAVEGDEKMVDSINKNVAANNLGNKLKAEARDLFLDPISAKELNSFDLAIINPPRNGASPQVKEISKSKLKNVIYVSCNPESFSRDSKILIDSGFKITNLTALDQFYSTKHLELIAIFLR